MYTREDRNEVGGAEGKRSGFRGNWRDFASASKKIDLFEAHQRSHFPFSSGQVAVLKSKLLSAER
jgi:hypothetical protein